ncbi:MAG: hypothetical protein ABL907_19590 [Hyphomicrobium sp.]
MDDELRQVIAGISGDYNEGTKIFMQLRSMLHENIDQRMELAHYVDRLAPTKEEVRRRFPTFDAGIHEYEHFTSLLACLCRDLLVERHGAGSDTPDAMVGTMIEVTREIVIAAVDRIAGGHAAKQ